MSDKHFITPDGRWMTISDDELYHWKYIKREKKNGKWVYFYNNDEYQAYKDAQSKQTQSINKASAALKSAKIMEDKLNQQSKEAASKATGKETDYELTDNRAMNRGKVGDDIKKAQEVLKDLGYDLGKTGDNKDGLDGSFGPVTQAAVKAYQKKKGLKVDGSIGPETMASLKADADKMNKTNREAKALSKAADEATKNRATAAENHATASKNAVAKTAAAKKAYEKTAGAKVADILTKHSDKFEKVDSWINKLLSKKKKK